MLWSQAKPASLLRIGRGARRPAALLSVLLTASWAQSPSGRNTDAPDDRAVQVEANLLDGNEPEAARSYEQILALHWERRKEEVKPAGMTSSFEDLGAVLGLAHFPDPELDAAIQTFDQSLETFSMNEDFYVASSRLLFRRGLAPEAEAVLARGARAFPDSRLLRQELAEHYVKDGRIGRALETLEQTRGMATPPGQDPVLERRERSLVEVRIGQLEAQSGRFDEAITAYRRALEIDPDCIPARLELAGRYLDSELPDEARGEYARVIALDPDSADAHYGLAELDLRAGRLKEAAEQARRAVRIDPEHRRARYVLARALIRAGRSKEATEALTAYRERETAAQSALNSKVRLSALTRSAAAALLDGRPDEAIDLFLEGIQAQPGSADLVFDLGVAQQKVGLQQAAAGTFRVILDRGCCPRGDSFLVHRNLSLVYDQLGDAESSRWQRALYLREYDRALTAALGRPPR